MSFKIGVVMFWWIFFVLIVILLIFIFKYKRSCEDLKRIISIIREDRRFSVSIFLKLKEDFLSLSKTTEFSIKELQELLNRIDIHPDIKSTPDKRILSLDDFVAEWKRISNIKEKNIYLKEKLYLLSKDDKKSFIINNFSSIPFEVHKKIIFEIGKIGGNDTKEFLINLLDRISSNDTKVLISDILGEMRCDDATEKIIKLLEESEPFSRAGYVDALIKIGNDRVKNYFKNQITKGAHLEKKEAENALALIR